MPNNFVFFGTPETARRTLEMLVSSGFRPSLVVTNPDAPQGRGLALAPSPVKAWAEKNGLFVYTPERLDEAACAIIRAHHLSFAIVVAYGKIFPESLIDAFPMGVLNVHYSLLPAYRGATPLEAALRNGETVTGVTVQKMVRELDAGDILAQAEVAITPTETARELRPRLIEAGADLLQKTLPTYLAGTIKPRAQDHAHATRAGKLKKEDGLLNLTVSGTQSWNTYRAYHDTIGTHFFTKEGMRVKVASASLSASGDFIIERVVPEGRREMPYADFKKLGHPMS